MYAAIKGLEALKIPCSVELYSDSEYLVNSMMQGWAKRWKEKNWWRNKKEKAANTDLWARLLALCDKHRVHFVWVKGHAGQRENERCDQLAFNALQKTGLPPDQEYEQRPETEPAGKITRVGQPCRKCGTPVIRKTPGKKSKRGRSHYFEYYLYCPDCHTMYMVEEAKRYFDEPGMF
jgi:ribonuclease HI